MNVLSPPVQPSTQSTPEKMVFRPNVPGRKGNKANPESPASNPFMTPSPISKTASKTSLVPSPSGRPATPTATGIPVVPTVPIVPAKKMDWLAAAKGTNVKVAQAPRPQTTISTDEALARVKGMGGTPKDSPLELRLWALPHFHAADAMNKAKKLVEAAIATAKQSVTGLLILPDPKTYRFVIGPGGATVNNIRKQTGSKVDVPKAGGSSEAIEIRGTRDAVEQAKEMVIEAVKNGAAGRR